MLDARITIRGALFNGSLARAVRVAAAEAEREMAEVGVSEVRAALRQVLQNPTGHYASRIQTTLAHGDYTVTDGGVIYGDWLVGTSGRNHKTRFKGYTHWRRAAQQLQKRYGAVASRIIDRRIRGA